MASLAALLLTPLYAVLQFWLREMNLMVFVVATFAAGIAITLTPRSESALSEVAGGAASRRDA